MNSLVKTFENRLEVSSREAKWRAIGLVVFVVVILVAITVWISFFPFQTSFTEHIPILPGNYEQVSDILDGEVLMEREQFLELAKGERMFISLGNSSISYMVKLEDVSYLYVQEVPKESIFVDVNQEIKDGVITRELSRNRDFAIFFFMIFLPVVFAVCCLLVFLHLTTNANKIYKGG